MISIKPYDGSYVVRSEDKDGKATKKIVQSEKPKAVN